jgi:hypothetical protein
MVHQSIKKVSALRWQRLPIRPNLFMTPFVKVPHMHAVSQAFGVPSGMRVAMVVVSAPERVRWCLTFYW